MAGCTVLCSSLRSEAAPANCSASKPAPSLHCSPRPVISPGQKRKATTLRTIPLEELWADREAVWVSFDGGVYDVTEFLDSHPGGSGRIEMVKGHDLSGAWSVYELHLQRQHIRDLLEVYRIGNLSEADRKRAEQRSEGTLGNYYDEDPERPAARRGELRIPSVHPWNHEPASLRSLTRTFFTPNELFFVRNHNAVPNIDEADYELEVEPNEEAGVTGATLTLHDLKTKFEKVEVVSTLQCAGNRQEDFVTDDRPLWVAPHWRNGAIGCAKWAGVRVRDVLRHAGLDVDGMALGRAQPPNAKIVNLIGADVDETSTPYAGVLPMEKAVDPFGDAILAYEMNGETLPRDHGYPIRLVSPGHAGCRNVKWVTTMQVAGAPSPLDAGSRLDRHFAPDVGFLEDVRHGEERLNLDQGPVIQTMPVQSIVCVPEDGTTVSAADVLRGGVPVEGVAWSGGGRGICRVEVSVDGGESFTAAHIKPFPPEASSAEAKVRPEFGAGRNWAWRQWTETMPLPEAARKDLEAGRPAQLTLAVRAVDGDFNSQPEHMNQCWNVLGVQVNHWNKVKLNIDPALPAGHMVPPPPPPPPGYPKESKKAATSG